MFNPALPNPFVGAVTPPPPAGPLEAAGNLAKTALDLFSLPGNFTRSVVGAGAKGLDALLGNPELQGMDNQEAFDTAMGRAANSPGFTALPVVGALGRLPAPFAKFVAAQLFDPLNAVGGGVGKQILNAGKLAKAGLSMKELESAALGLGKSPDELLAAFASPTGKLYKGAELLDAVDGATSSLISGLFSAPFKGATKLGEMIPFEREIVGGVGPDLTAQVRNSENLTDYATALSKRAYLKQFEGGLKEALTHYKAAGGDFAEIDPSMLPTDLAAIFTDQVQAGFGHHVRALGRERESLEKMFQDVWSSRNPGQIFDPAQFQGANSLETFTKLIDSLGIPHGDIGSTVDLLNSTKTHISDQDWNRFDRIVRAYPSGDILTDNPLDLVLDRVVRDRAKSLQITEPEGVSKAWQTGTALFSEQALQSLSYLFTNALGGIGMGALEGVNPFKVGRNLLDNFGSAARGESVFTNGTRDLAAALGLIDELGKPILPRAVSAEGAGMLNEANPSREYTGKGLTAAQQIGAPKLAAGGAILGGTSGYVQSPDDSTPGETLTNVLVGMGTGGGAGAAMPTLSKYLLQRFSRGIEDVLRQSAWETGTRRGVAASSDQMEAIIRQAFRDGFTPDTVVPGVDIANTPTGKLVDLLRQRGVEPPTITSGVNTWGPTVEPDWRMLEAMKAHAVAGGQVRNPNGPGADWLQALINAAQPTTTPGTTPKINVEEAIRAAREIEGMFSPRTMRDLIEQIAGGSPESAQAAEAAWRDVIHGASNQGADLSNTINFDYSNLNNMEEMVRQIIPFSTWAMKAFPFFARHIAEHPAILTSALEINRQSREMREQQGLTNRVQGSLPMGDAMDSVWSALLGRNVDTYSNPLRGLVPFSDTAKNLESLDQEENPIAAAYRAITAFGPSVHPALEFIARTAGLLGTDTPAKGLMRLSGPIQGATAVLGVNRGRGIATDAALTEGEGKLREALSGREVTDLAQIAAERRVDELALKTTGKTITSGDPTVAQYLQAKAKHTGPIWDQAMKDAMRERGLRSLVGYISNQVAPSAIVSEDEAKIRQARAGLLVPLGLSTQVRELATVTPKAPIEGETYREVQKIAQQLPPDSGIKPEHIQEVLAQPTAENVNWLFRAIYEWQQEQHPEISAYSGSGSPEQRRLSNQLGEYRNLAAAIPDLQNLPPDEVRAIQHQFDEAKNMPHGRGLGTATDKWLASINQGRTQFRNANPFLNEYLSWLAARQGRGSAEQFVAERGQR